MNLSELTTALSQTENLWGLIVFEMVGQGCLNGMWSNNHHSRNFMNEIARKQNGDMDKLEGIYTVTYIDIDNQPFVGELLITLNNGLYNLKWVFGNQGDNNFTGVGIQTGESQLTVIYWR